MGAGQSNIDVSKLDTRQPSDVSESDIEYRLNDTIEKIKKELNNRSKLITNRKVKTDVLLNEVAQMCSYLEKHLKYDQNTIYNIKLLNYLKEKHNVYDTKSLDNFVDELKKLAVIEEKNRLIKEKDNAEKKLLQAKDILRKQVEKQEELKAKYKSDVEKFMAEQKRKREANNAEKQEIRKKAKEQVYAQLRKQKTKKRENRASFLQKHGIKLDNISVYKHTNKEKKQNNQKRIQQKAKKLMEEKLEQTRRKQNQMKKLRNEIRSEVNRERERRNNLVRRTVQQERKRSAANQARLRGAIAETESRLSSKPSTVIKEVRTPTFLSANALRRHSDLYPSKTTLVSDW